MKISSPFFLFLAWCPSWLEVGINGHNFGRGPYKYHSIKVWLQLAQWFLRRRLKFTADGRMPSDGKSSLGLWPGELKRGDEILKKSSPLKLLNQSQPKFAEMILGWSPSKIMSGISDLRPKWPPQPNLI